MKLPQTAALVRVTHLPTCGSTNQYVQDLTQATPQLAPLLVVTAAQTAGRGRQGRSWQETPGNSLASSYYVPAWPPGAANATWIPLLAGVALATALEPWKHVEIKWPNDVLLPLTASAQRPDELATARGGYKLAGILCEKSAAGYIIGAGLNLYTPATQLPAGATSLAACGALPEPAPELEQLADAILSSYIAKLQQLLQLAQHHPAQVPHEVASQLATIGKKVRAELPDGSEIMGHATGLGANGELLVTAGDGQEIAIAAADILHLRAG